VPPLELPAHRVLLLCVLLSAALAVSWLLTTHLSPWVAFHSDAVVALALCAAALGTSLTAGARLLVPRSAVLAAALALVPLIQHQLGLIHFAGDAVMASLYLLALAVAIYLGNAFRSVDERSLHPLVWCFVVVGLMSTGLALAQWLRIDMGGVAALPLKPGARPYANFAQPNQLATALMLGVAATALLVEWRHISVGAFGLISGFLGLGVALTQSRAGVLQVFGLAIWLLLIERRAKLHLPRTAICVFVAVFLVTVALLPAIAAALDLDSQEAVRVSKGVRLIHWGTVLDAVIREPWTGYGWNQVSVAVARVAQDHPPSGEMIEHSHNLILDLLAWNGVPLGVAILLAIACWIYRQIATCSNSESALLIGMVGIFTLHSLVEFPLEYAYFLIPMGLIIGMLSYTSGELSRAMFIPRTALVLLTLAASALTISICREYLDLEENHRALRFESAGIGADRVATTVPEVVVLTQLREFLRYARSEAKREMSAAELEGMRLVAERYGYAPVLFRYAYALALNGRDQDAGRVLVRLCRLNPPPLCDEAELNWQQLMSTAPELTAVPFPRSPWRETASR
jgi:O-antigen ligase